jgi:hypothetical protein
MGRIYTVPFAGTVTNAGGNTDLLELVPADDKPCRLRGIVLSNYSEFADAAEEAVNISVMRLAATVTSGNGTATTGQPVEDVDVAAGFAAEVNGATVATTSGASVTLVEFAWNLRNSPYEMWWPDREFAPQVRQASGLFVRMNSTLADDASLACTFYIEEE